MYERIKYNSKIENKRYQQNPKPELYRQIMEIEHSNKLIHSTTDSEIKIKMDKKKLKIRLDSSQDNQNSNEDTDTEVKEETHALNQLFSKAGVPFPRLKDPHQKNQERTIPLRQRHLPPSFWVEPKEHRKALQFQRQNFTLDHTLLQHDRLTQQYISQYYGMVNHTGRYTAAQTHVDFNMGLFSQRLASLNSNSSIASSNLCSSIDGSIPPGFNPFGRLGRFNTPCNIRGYECFHESTSRLPQMTSSPLSRMPTQVGFHQKYIPFSTVPDQTTLQRVESELLRLPEAKEDNTYIDRGNVMAYPSPELILSKLKYSNVVKPLATKSRFVFNRYHPYFGS